MVAEFIVDLDLGLHFGREILEIIRQAYDRSRVQIVAHTGVGIELLVHHRRLKVLEHAIGDQILGEDVPCTTLYARGAGAAALANDLTGSVRRRSNRRRIGSVMSRPVLTLRHEAREKL